MTVLITGASKSGKSAVAEELAAETAEALGAKKDALAAGAGSRPICSTCHSLFFVSWVNELFFLTSLQSRSFDPLSLRGRLHEGRPIRGRNFGLLPSFGVNRRAGSA